MITNNEIREIGRLDGVSKYVGMCVCMLGGVILALLSGVSVIAIEGSVLKWSVFALAYVGAAACLYAAFRIRKTITPADDRAAAKVLAAHLNEKNKR